ncbi:MAG: type II toxin-antitoxin system PemK/MazF family toxin [Bacteroidetes bacterium]|jgi:mRNA interferase MazF|nr:type II toxin-antitoxin system PemK/MazF family toxin [Bacteroidota bacterium]
MVVLKNEVWLTSLDPTIGREINKSRPCVILSPNVINKYSATVTVAPLTSTLKKYPTRIDCNVNGKKGQIVIDQIRTIDKTRLIKKISTINEATAEKIYETIVAYFR